MVVSPGRKVSRVLYLALLCSAFLLSGLVFAEETGGGAQRTPAQWLEEMNRSVVHRSFRGDFVYLSGPYLEAMQLRHWIVDGRPRESLYSLTGEPREIVRDADLLTITTWEDGKPHKVVHPSRGRLSPLKPLEAAMLQRHYRLLMGKPARIAGRNGVVVALVPRDDLRYGYRLTLDQESALPLDLTVMDGSGNLISRIMFVRLQLEETDPVSGGADQDESGAGAEGTVVRSQSGARNPENEEDPLAGSSWTFRELPDGFQVISHQHDESIGQEHFVLSDGLATVSAYIEPLAEGDRPFTGKTSLGSVNAYGLPIGKYQMTVVGEVPHKTLSLVAHALVRKP